MAYRLNTGSEDASATLEILRLIADSAPSLLSYVDADGRYRFVNKAYERAFGRPKDDLIGAHVRDVVGPAYQEIEPHMLAAIAGQTVQYENVLQLPGRGNVVFEVTYTPDVGSDGMVRGIVVAASDITDRKGREEAQERIAATASLRSDLVSLFASGEKTLRECLQESTDRLLGILNAAFVRVWTFNEHDEMLELQASSGMYRHIDGHHGRIPLGAYKIGLIAQERSPHITNDVPHDPRISDRDWAAREGIQAFAGYPLLLGGRVIGVVAFFSKRMIDAPALQLLGTIADVLAQAIVRKQQEASLKRSNEMRRILSDASALLAKTLDYESTLKNVAHIALPELGDWCIVDILEEDAQLRRIALANADPELIRRAHELHRQNPIDMAAPYGAPDIIRTKASRLIESIDDAMIESSPLSEQERAFVKDLKLRSYMGIPLRARGRILGVISFASSQRTYEGSDLAVAEELASRIAMAIDNARLYQLATSGEKQMRFFADLSLGLANSLSYQDTLNMIARLSVATLCDYAIIYTIAGSGVTRAASAHRDPHDDALMQQLLKEPVTPSVQLQVLKVAETGQPLVALEVDPEHIRQSQGAPAYVALLEKLNPTSCIVVPLRARGRSLGALCIAMTNSGRRLHRSDVFIVEEIGRRAALALDNASLYEAAIASSRVKDEFLAVLSHELRTPITSVYGWLTLLRRGGLSEEKQREAMEVMGRNVRAQITLIESLLDLSKIAQGKVQLELADIDPASAIAAAIDVVRPAAEAKNLRIQFKHDAEGAVLRADPTRLQQMLWNLLSNAVKFTPRNGSIHIAVKASDRELMVSIHDDGIGIDPALLVVIFDRFRQGDSSSTRVHGGLGVGLSIVKHLVEAHGGSIEAQSEGVSRGSTFILRLPLR